MSFLLYLFLGIALIFYAKNLQQKQIAQLSDEFKLLLFKMFEKRNNYSLYFSLLVMAAFLTIIWLNLFDLHLTLLAFAFVNIIAVAIPLNINYNKLVKANFPVEFTNNYIVTSALRVLGTIIIFSYIFLAD